MPLLIDAARLHVSEGEIVQALQEVWGDYREQPVFSAGCAVPAAFAEVPRGDGHHGHAARAELGWSGSD